MNKLEFFFTDIFSSINSCATNVFKNKSYTIDSEKRDLSKNDNVVMSSFNRPTAVTQYYNCHFILERNGLYDLNDISISVDSHVYYTWCSNKPAYDQLDILQIAVDRNCYTIKTFSYILYLSGGICPQPGYPLDYSNNYRNPTAGADRTDLPGFSEKQNIPKRTTQHKTVKTFRHTRNRLISRCMNRIVQPDSANIKCDGELLIR